MHRAETTPLLRATNLTKHYETTGGILDRLLGRGRTVRAVDGVDLELYAGETLGVVGESGCGKTTLGRTLLRLLEPTAGSVTYRPRVASADDSTRREIELTDADAATLRDLRTDLQYVFQDPLSSLDPRWTVGEIVAEPLDIHGLADGETRAERVAELLETVGLSPEYAARYPHECSGGQRQRIGIARALAVEPAVVVLDEPVSALDVSVQAQILDLLVDLQEELGLSYVVIAHDLRVVEHLADRVAVMYLGEFAEVGTTEDVFAPPHHPYTEALLSAIPEPDPCWTGDRIRLPGTVPSPADPPSGCRFHTRCPRVVQPGSFDLEQSAWRAMLAFKWRLADATAAPDEDAVDTVTAILADEAASVDGDGTRTDPTARPRDEFGALVRTAFDVPDPVADRRAERALAQALDRLHDGNIDAALDRLEAVFESPCETRQPERTRTGETHEIACHLYDTDGDDGAVRSDSSRTERAVTEETEVTDAGTDD